MNEDNFELSGVQYRLWASTIVTGVYLKKDASPQVPSITGVDLLSAIASQWISLTKEN